MQLFAVTTHRSKPFGVHVAQSVGRTFAALGSRYTIGAFRMCGSPFAELTYRFPDGMPDSRDQNGTYVSHWDEAGRHVAFEVGLEFPVSGPLGDGADWRMAVTNEPDGTHGIWLTGLRGGQRYPVKAQHGVSGADLCRYTIQLHAEAMSAVAK